MTIRSLRDRLVRDRFQRGDDSGSLTMALLLTLVGVVLSALLVPIVVTQVESTRFDARRVDALNAAHAGLEVALGQIQVAVQAADSGSGSGGLVGDLLCVILHSCPSGDLPVPCTLQGDVGTGSAARYRVTIEYFGPGDPPTANRIPCDPQRGTSGVPASAVLRSAGTEQATTRTLEATYTFQPTKQSRCRGLFVPLLQLCVDLPMLDGIFGNQAWTISWGRGDGTSYVIIDLFGNCVSRTGSTGTLLPGGAVGLTIARCNGSPDQQWSAPPAPFTNVRES
jgi:hypothetical protein